MKTIKKEGNIKRVTDEEADSYIKMNWKYISKAEWKKEFHSETKAKKEVGEK